MLTQRHEEERVGERAARKRESTRFGPSCVFFLPGPPLCKWGQPGALFVLPEVSLRPSGLPLTFLCPIFQPFPSLVFQPPPFWTPISCSNYLTQISRQTEFEWVAGQEDQVIELTSLPLPVKLKTANTPVCYDCVNFPLNAGPLIFFADVFGLLGFTPHIPFTCIRVTLLIASNYLFILRALTALY